MLKNRWGENNSDYGQVALGFEGCVLWWHLLVCDLSLLVWHREVWDYLPARAVCAATLRRAAVPRTQWWWRWWIEAPVFLTWNPMKHAHLLMSFSPRTHWWEDIHSNCGGFEPLGRIWIPHSCSQRDWDWGAQSALWEAEDRRGPWVAPRIQELLFLRERLWISLHFSPNEALC